MRFPVIAGVAAALAVTSSAASAQEEEPKKWEELFFPFPIVGAPPQLEQQVQVFNSYFRGNAGSGDVPSVEVAYIATPHLGLVATVPFQFGFGGQTTGFQDAQLLVQWLARVALGASFNVRGDAVHAQTYTITAAFDIPNPYGY